ncbi:hypothetical protein M979_1080 [Buttiauxella noackiae ATCC 51607]|uniref:Uncharacterized protein n=1 Tax=Buttiauxella noackiae ATCC 51607 TaxID=1354255 RepID=A0A1B7HVU7_9ENTR|nr:hypothetical protein [Buttiauxella noackiae]OAT19768.1 hypothetical protein M979_1080 [Buttiauxella noackiae ATCC 51607]
MNIQLASNIYSLPAIENMLEQFSDYLEGHCVFNGELDLQLNVRDEFRSDYAEIINSFLNNILDLSIQEKLNHEC